MIRTLHGGEWVYYTVEEWRARIGYIDPQTENEDGWLLRFYIRMKPTFTLIQRFGKITIREIAANTGQSETTIRSNIEAAYIRQWLDRERPARSKTYLYFLNNVPCIKALQS
jgi:hypothetical protein